MKNKLIVIIVVLLVAGFFIYRGGPSAPANKSLAGLPAPVQGAANGTCTIKKDGFTAEITYKASYEINALVVSTKNYRGPGVFDRLAPVDAALCWGTVAEKNDEMDFHWSQSGRWYYWYVSAADTQKISGSSEVSTQSSNNHLVPADDDTEKLVKKIKTGDHVLITGYLIDINATTDSGSVYTNYSSTTRNDTGDHACEIIYVTDVKWL